ncbi:T9SS type A sorting domain-containing protein [Bacteroidota bacterium]
MKTNNLLLTALLCIVILFGFNLNINAQTQKGSDIDGETPGIYSGGAVCMPDSNTVAIGAFVGGAMAGQVRIYTWDGSSWQQKGLEIDGEAVGDWSGKSVSMPDANTVAIGAPRNEENGDDAGQVRIYAWDGSSWQKKGNDIDGNAAYIWFGNSVSMPNANTVAIGAPNSSKIVDEGHVSIYSWNTTSSGWIQRGNDIVGEAIGDWSGFSISMPDTNTVAIGAPRNNGSGFYAGQVRIYKWNGNTWMQKGADIDGDATYDQSGFSVSMPDANTIAIGALYNDEGGTDAGQVRIYVWNGSNWILKGKSITGESTDDASGSSVCMPDSNTVAIGAPYNDGSGTNAGHVRIYTWEGNNWVQKGDDIDGESADDQSGFPVSMPDANTIAIGAWFNGLSDAGHVRIYTLNNVNFQQDDFEDYLTIYPNPTVENVTIDLGNTFPLVEVIVRNTLGQEVSRNLFHNSSIIQLSIKEKAGVYFIELNADNLRYFNKVIIK